MEKKPKTTQKESENPTAQHDQTLQQKHPSPLQKRLSGKNDRSKRF